MPRSNYSRQIKDLAEGMEDLLKAAAGHKMNLHLRSEMSQNVPKEVVQKVNVLLLDVDETLDLK